MSLIDKILNPLDCKDLKAVSLPEPGPFTSTFNVLKPASKNNGIRAMIGQTAAIDVRPSATIEKHGQTRAIRRREIALQPLA